MTKDQIKQTCDIKAMSGRNESLKQHQVETSLETSGYISLRAFAVHDFNWRLISAHLYINCYF